MPCAGYLLFIKIMMHITNWIHDGSDGWKEEEEILKKMEEGERTTV
jgi:hypothetical protein